MKQPKLATLDEINGLKQMVRIGMVLSLAHAIQGRNPSRSFDECKLEAIVQFEAAVAEDWQV